MNTQLQPNWVTGFSDAESSFLINILKNKVKTSVQIQLRFQFGLHIKDLDILKFIKTYFNEVGNITVRENVAQFRVSSLADLEVIVKHFDLYPLITQKWIDYQLFKQAFELVKNKEHLTSEGFQKILSIRASMNKGLSDSLKLEYPNIIPMEKPTKLNIEIIDPNWISGFVSGEGNFFINISGSKIKLRFTITQHSRETSLLKYLVGFFGCGNNYFYTNKDAGYYFVEKFSDIFEKIIPFLRKYPVIGVKEKDFADFCEASEIVKNKEHLTEAGLEKIRKIKTGMNRNRVLLNDSLLEEIQIVESSIFPTVLFIKIFAHLYLICLNLLRYLLNWFKQLSIMSINNPKSRHLNKIIGIKSTWLSNANIFAYTTTKSND